jgi:hypothetical protein
MAGPSGAGFAPAKMCDLARPHGNFFFGYASIVIQNKIMAGVIGMLQLPEIPARSFNCQALDCLA